MQSTDISGISEGLLAGRFRPLARAISMVERDDPDAEKLLGEIYPSTGRARVIGVTGSPGAGKSTLVAGLTRFYPSSSPRTPAPPSASPFARP